MTYQILHGNNLDILPTLADNSIDSIVTDPPYELGFMGKKWDSSGIAYSVELWQQCLRVLKPGGHLLSFGGTRTYHRVAVAIEDAGFDIRDNIAWLYGSGFPKSMDISKAIDKSDATALRRERDLEFVHWMRTTGLKQQQINNIIGKSDVGSHYLRLDQPVVATAELFDKLRPYLPEVPENIEKLVAERTVESENYKKREVIGQKQGTKSVDSGGHGIVPGGITEPVELDITAPATPEAKQWQGWGTALKPAFEPVIVARKPLGGEIAVRCIIENELKKLGQEEITWTRPVKDAVKQSQNKTSGSTSQPKTAETSAKPVSESGMQNTGQTTESFIESQPEGLVNETQSELGNLQESLAKDLKTKSLQLTEKSVSAVENQTEHSLHLTTLTGADQSTENKPKARSGTSSDGKDSHLVIESFAGIATGLTGSLATVHINKLSDGTFEWPANLPEVEKVAPTVANNVLKWGTGGLNIDGSRIGTETISTHNAPKGSFAGGEPDRGSDTSSYKEHTGRWPANIILDPYTAELLDQQSGTTKSTIHSRGGGSNSGYQGGWGDDLPKLRGLEDSGGASRFFYVAKASKRDRNEGLEELDAQRHSDRELADGVGGDNPRNRTNQAKQNFHPTVKPTSLMEYLIKLVTPPNGTVLDPFTGSGSTGKAAILQGFDFIGIEMTEEYLPIIEGRLKHAERIVAERNKEASLLEQEKLF